MSAPAWRSRYFNFPRSSPVEGGGEPQTYTKDMIDGFLVNDGSFLNRYRGRTGSESCVMTDGNVLSRHRGRTLSDALALTDGQFLGLHKYRTQSDACLPTDGSFLNRHRTPTLIDPVTLTDSQSLTRIRGRTLDDPLTVTDQILIGRLRIRHLIDVIASVTDDFSASLGKVLTQIMDDGLLVSDGIMNLSRYRGRTLQESVTLTDQTVLGRLRIRHLLDTIASVTDSFNADLGRVINKIMSDGLLLTDGIVNLTRYRNRTQQDTVALTDEEAHSLYRSIRLGETLTITDVENHSRHRTIFSSDSVTITDAQSHFLTRTLWLSDSVTVMDNTLVARFRFRHMTDDIARLFDGLEWTIVGVPPEFEPVTIEVRVRLGTRDSVTVGHVMTAQLGKHDFAALGQHAPVRLSADQRMTLGGYN